MRYTHILAAAAGLAALACPLVQTAFAQMSPNGWIIEVQDTILGPVGSGLPQATTIEVYAKFDSAVDYAFAAGLFDFMASEGGAAGVNWTDNIRVTPFDFPTPGAPDDGLLIATGATAIQPGQIHFPPAGIIGDDSNPALVWTIEYTATDFTPRIIDLATGTNRFDLYTDAATPESRSVDTGTLMEGMGQIQIIPTPGALACLGMAGVMLVRRQR